MFERCIAPEALVLLKELVRRDVVRAFEFYLAGGTALALQLGHRISEDLDFFTKLRFHSQELVEAVARGLEAEVLDMTEGALHVLFSKKVRISFLYYPYRVVFPFQEFHGCPVADPRDIGAAKIIAIGQRGAKKDFVDLYCLLSKYSLEELKNAVEQKYAGIRYSWVHLARSLGYLEDAEQDPMPIIISGSKERRLTSAEWEKIKAFFIQLQREILTAFS